MEEAVFTDEKQQREENIREITDKLAEAFADNEEWLAVLGKACQCTKAEKKCKTYFFHIS